MHSLTHLTQYEACRITRCKPTHARGTKCAQHRTISNRRHSETQQDRHTTTHTSCLAGAQNKHTACIPRQTHTDRYIDDRRPHPNTYLAIVTGQFRLELGDLLLCLPIVLQQRGMLARKRRVTSLTSTPAKGGRLV